MRLLVVSQYFWPENFRVNDLAVELVKRGHEVVVLTGVPNYPDGEVFPDFKRDRAAFAVFHGVEIVRVPMRPRGRTRRGLVLNYLSYALSASIIGPWKLRGRKFDAIFVYEPSPVTVGIPAVILRAIKKAPLAFWVLDLWPETLEAIGVVRSKRLLKVVGGLVSFIYNRCDLVLAQSRSFIPQIAKYRKAAAGHIEYWPSWSETEFDLGNTPPAAEVPTRPDTFDVMFAGNIGEGQDFPSVLAAAERLKAHPHIRWLVVGDGRMAKWVNDEILRRGLQNSVLMLGRHPVERMPSFFKHADALLVCLGDKPIFSMTIPGKLQSYLAASIPIVAMLNGEGAELIRRSECGVTCRAGDANGLADAVLHLASLSTEQRMQMGQNGSVVSRNEFDRGKLITCLEAWLEDLRSAARETA